MYHDIQAGISFVSTIKSVLLSSSPKVQKFRRKGLLKIKFITFLRGLRPNKDPDLDLELNLALLESERGRVQVQTSRPAWPALSPVQARLCLRQTFAR